MSARAARTALLSEFAAPTLEDWQAQVVRLLKGRSFEKVMLTTTPEEITLRPLYTSASTAALRHLRSAPGEFPYLRGIHAPDAAAPWEIAQEIYGPTPEEFGAALSEALTGGQTAIHLRVDRATARGADPDSADPDEIGRAGLSLADLTDLARALAGADLTRQPIYLQAGPATLPVAALLVALLRSRAGDSGGLRGSLGYDPLAHWVVRGRLPAPLDALYDEAALLTRWARDAAPALKTLVASGVAYHEAGANAVQELACAFGSAIGTLRACETRGIAPQEAALGLACEFAIGPRFFVEISKLRAARLIWARIVHAFGGSAAAARLTIHARTARYGKTIFDPYVNILRATTEAFAAIAGGCQSLDVGPFDELGGPPSARALRLARNTQLILREESHLDQVIDPGGGAHLIEMLTAELAEKAWALFQEIEAEGGLAAALGAGSIQARVRTVAQRRAAATARRRVRLVGTNIYPHADERISAPTWPDCSARGAEIAARRPTRETSSPTDMNQLVALLQDGATLGAVTGALRGAAIGQCAIVPLAPIRAAEGFETLRRRILAWREAGGTDPQVFLANVGLVSEYMPRSDFTRTFFEIGGFAVAAEKWFPTADEACGAALASGASIVVIVSTDARYPDIVPILARRLKAAEPARTVILAGAPCDDLSTAVDHCIQLRSDALALLTLLAEQMGVPA